MIVVANGTPPDAVAPLLARDDLVVIASPVNHGFSGGCNLAARHATADRLVFLNDDVTVRHGWLDGLMRALDGDESIAVAGSKVVLSDGRLQEAGSVIWSDGSTSGVGRGQEETAERFERRRAVDYVSFCSAIVRRAAWDQAGGFDERYFPAYYEDADLCLTLGISGWRVVYEPTSVVDHVEGASADRHFRDFLARRHQRLFAAKWATALPSHEPPPQSEAERPAAVERALRRAAERPAPDRRADAAGPGAHAPEQDGDALLQLQVRHLRAAVRVCDEYAEALRQELASRTVRDVLRHRLWPAYRRVISYWSQRGGGRQR
jgi:hypothetical protein